MLSFGVAKVEFKLYLFKVLQELEQLHLNFRLKIAHKGHSILESLLLIHQIKRQTG